MQIRRLAIEVAEFEMEELAPPRLINFGPESLGIFKGLRHLFLDCSCTWSMVYTLRCTRAGVRRCMRPSDPGVISSQLRATTKQ